MADTVIRSCFISQDTRVHRAGIHALVAIIRSCWHSGKQHVCHWTRTWICPLAHGASSSITLKLLSFEGQEGSGRSRQNAGYSCIAHFSLSWTMLLNCLLLLLPMTLALSEHTPRVQLSVRKVSASTQNWVRTHLAPTWQSAGTPVNCYSYYFYCCCRRAHAGFCRNSAAV